MSTRRSEYRRRRHRRRRKIRRVLVTLIVLAALAGIFFLMYPLETVVVSGNIHESAGHITDLVLDAPCGGNTVLAFLMNRNRNISGDDFVESLHAELTSRNSIRVRVTEKRMTGYVKVGKQYCYIGRRGTVLLLSSRTWKGDGIPEVDGFELLTDVHKGETLPIRGTKPFVLLDNLKSLSDFYGITPDKVTFSDDYSMTLHYGNVQVLMGSGANLEDRMKQLAGILKKMDNTWSGTLHLENYNGTQNQVIFDRS